MKAFLWIVGAIFLTTGPALGQAVHDSAGVRIFESTGALWRAGEQWRVGETPAVRIGVIGGAPELQFFRISSLVFAANGDIIVADGSSGQVRTFDSTGRFRSSYGSPGEGPGEFRSLSWVGSCMGGQVLAYDVRLGRITEVGNTPAKTWHLGAQGMGPPPRQVRCSEGGLLGIGQLLPPGAPTPGPSRGRALIEFFGPGFESVGTVEVPGDDRYFMEGNLFPRPLGRRTVIAASGHLFALGTQDESEVVFFDERGETKQVFRWSQSDLVVRSDDIGAYVNGLIAAASPDRETGIRAMYRDHVFPEFLPAFGRLILDEVGNLWVEQTQRPGVSANSWRVFSNAGVLLGSIDFPERFVPLSISSNRVGGVWRDVMDVEYVWVFDLIKHVPS